MPSSYKYMGKFIKDAEEPAVRINDRGLNDVFIYTSNAVNHFVETPPGGPYHTTGNMLYLDHSQEIPLRPGFGKIVVGPKYIFVEFGNSLEVLHHNGELFRCFVGNNVICENGLFLITGLSSSVSPIGLSISYVVDSDANAIFTKSRNNIMDFTEEGDVVYLINGSDKSKEEITDNNDTYLIIESFKDLKRYDFASDPIFEMEDIMAYENGTIIQNTRCCAHLYLEEPNESPVMHPCFVVLCTNEIFVIFKNYVIRKGINKEYLKIGADEFVIHNYLERESFYELILVLSLFSNIRIDFPEKIEGFLCKLIHCNIKVEPFLERIFSNYNLKSDISDHIICRAYRRVDDKAKAMLDTYIEITKLSADALYYIIIYKLEYIDYFVKLCIKEKRLFYLRELVPFFDKINKLKELRVCLLRNQLFILDYRGFEKIIEMEKMEIDSQESIFNRT